MTRRGPLTAKVYAGWMGEGSRLRLPLPNPSKLRQGELSGFLVSLAF
jgi:hypothetical protein